MADKADGNMIVSLDIGTSKISAVVAERQEDGEIQVVGIGSADANGMKRGVVVNIDAYESLSDAHREALDGSVQESLDHYVANYGELLAKWDSVLAEKGVTKVEISADVIDAFRSTKDELRQTR